MVGNTAAYDNYTAAAAASLVPAFQRKVDSSFVHSAAAGDIETTAAVAAADNNNVVVAVVVVVGYTRQIEAEVLRLPCSLNLQCSILELTLEYEYRCPRDQGSEEECERPKAVCMNEPFSMEAKSSRECTDCD